MRTAYAEVFADRGPAAAGALPAVGALPVVGVAFLYTVETWWLARERSLAHPPVYAVAWLALVFLGTRTAGVRQQA